MKFLPFIFLFTFQLNAQNWIDFKETIQVDDTIYSKATGLPYTGLITETAENGTIIWKARASKGLYNGKYCAFYPDGDTLQKGEYKNGKLNGFIYYYESNTAFGQPTIPHCWLKQYYVNGVKNGKSESYFENGKPFISSVYVKNIQTGMCSIYNKDGDIVAKGELIKSQAVGTWIVYKIDKSISATLIFSNGKFSSCEGNCSDFDYNTDFDDLTSLALGIN